VIGTQDRRPRSLGRFPAAVTAFVILVASAAPAAAAPGDLDPSFGDDGHASVPFRYGGAAALDLHDDGSIVTAGTSGYRGQHITVVRMTEYGALDATFGGDGVVRPAFLGDAWGSAVAVADDGSVIAVGSIGKRVAVARFLEDGSPDEGFSGDGRLSFRSGASRWTGIDVAALPGGNVLVAAEVRRPGDAMVGLLSILPDGSFDPGFDGDGRTRFLLGPPKRVHGVSVAVDDGRVFAAFGKPHGIGLVGWQLNGEVDPTVGVDGVAKLPVEGVGRVIDVEVDLAGRPLISTVSFSDDVFPFGSGLIRALPEGTLDSTWSDDGFASPGAPLSGMTGIAVQDDGKVVVSGLECCGAGSGEAAWVVARFDTSGDLDDTFGTEGVVASNDFSESGARDVAVQPDGKLVVTGSAGFFYGFAVRRYLVE